jgi:hypothetical protein
VSNFRPPNFRCSLLLALFPLNLPPAPSPVSKNPLGKAFLKISPGADPQSAGLESFGRFLWARCRDAAQALAAADLLLRDGNLELVAMDLQLNPLRELGRLPSSSWHRLRGLAEKSGAALVALTPRRIIPSAHLRVELDGAFALDAFDFPSEELRGRLLLRVVRRRVLGLTPAESSLTTKRKAG